jgi:DNA-3-methyladenine glycosylase
MENWSTKLFGKRSDKSQVLDSVILSNDYYNRDTVTVAQDLLGKILVVNSKPEYSMGHPQAEVTAGRIVETEAYHGTDPASHSARGETPRTSVMFGDPGVAYVYFIYGMYEMLNFVTERKGYPGAVLIRALEPLLGEGLMKQRRKQSSLLQLTNGPGRLSQAMGIKMSHNKQSLRGPSLYVCEGGDEALSLSKSPRVGIKQGTDQLWRFFVTDSPWLSRVPQNSAAIPVRSL